MHNCARCKGYKVIYANYVNYRSSVLLGFILLLKIYFLTVHYCLSSGGTFLSLQFSIDSVLVEHFLA